MLSSSLSLSFKNIVSRAIRNWNDAIDDFKVSRNGGYQFTVRVSEQFMDRLNRLRAETGVHSRGGQIRQALQLYEFLFFKLKEGYSFRIVNDETKESKNIELFG